MPLFGPNIDKLKAAGDVEGLIEALGSNKLRVRESAADALRGLGDPRTLDLLIAALGDPNPNVRYRAAYGLGVLYDPRAVEPLTAALGDEDANVRLMAASGLSDLRYRGVAEAGHALDRARRDSSSG
jgi:HEAT repeat protein